MFPADILFSNSEFALDFKLVLQYHEFNDLTSLLAQQYLHLNMDIEFGDTILFNCSNPSMLLEVFHLQLYFEPRS